MNDNTNNMVERKEKLTKIRAVKIGCMDEDDVVEADVVKIGIAGSGVIKIGGENQELYSDNEREEMAEVSSYIVDWVSDFSRKNGVVAGISSHPECGAGLAQGFSESDLIEETRHLSLNTKIDYLGHLDTITNRSEVPGDSISWFTRESGPHTANSINITVGGGITGDEKGLLEKNHKGKAFDISADWVFHALEAGADRKEVINNLVFQLRLAYAIAEGVRMNETPFGIYDGGRLGVSEVSTNEEIVREAIKIAQDQINKGSWKAASHH